MHASIIRRKPHDIINNSFTWFLWKMNVNSLQHDMVNIKDKKMLCFTINLNVNTLK